MYICIYIKRFLYVDKVYHAPKIFIGSLTTVACFFECIIFYFSKDLIEKVGVGNLLSLAQLAYIVRVLCYTIIPLDRYVFQKVYGIQNIFLKKKLNLNNFKLKKHIKIYITYQFHNHPQTYLFILIFFASNLKKH